MEEIPETEFDELIKACKKNAQVHQKDHEKRIWLALGYIVVFTVAFNYVNGYLIDRMPGSPEWGLLTMLWVFLALSFQDIAIAHIMGGDGIFVKPCLRSIKRLFKK